METVNPKEWSQNRKTCDQNLTLITYTHCSWRFLWPFLLLTFFLEGIKKNINSSNLFQFLELSWGLNFLPKLLRHELFPIFEPKWTKTPYFGDAHPTWNRDSLECRYANSYDLGLMTLPLPQRTQWELIDSDPHSAHFGPRKSAGKFSHHGALRLWSFQGFFCLKPYWDVHGT